MIPVAYMVLLKKFGPWLIIVLLFVGIYAFGHSRGSAKWKVRFNDANTERKQAVIERDQARVAVDLCNEATEKYKTDAADRISRLETELQRKPEIITKYKDRIEVVEKIIQSEDCMTALIEVDEVLRGVTPP